ncbi:hypothetical protein PI125_g10303 [Phytophthora idaei]|nr:hypothetical protein PI125_g10303 [Phytophthora idaei]
MEEFYNQIRQWYDPTKHCGLLPDKADKLLKAPGENPVHSERSRYCINAFVNKTSEGQGSQRPDRSGKPRDLHCNTAVKISSLYRTAEFARSEVSMPVELHPGEARGYWKQQDRNLWFEPASSEVVSEPPRIRRIAKARRSGVVGAADLLPGESRGYWKYHAPGKWFRQAKVEGKINNEKAIMLVDNGADVSTVDTAFARKVGCRIDRSWSKDCVGIGESVYKTKGRTRIKITLAGCLVYWFDIWVSDLSGQEAILGMDFMVPAGIRLDLADGTMNFPDEMKIQLSGHRSLYNEKVGIVKTKEATQIEIGESCELPQRLKLSDQEKLWVVRGEKWVPTAVKGLGRSWYLRLTNISDMTLQLQGNEQISMWLAPGSVPCRPGYVSVGSRRYMEWQNLAYEATTDTRSEQVQLQRIGLDRGQPAQIKSTVARSREEMCGRDGPPSDPDAPITRPPRWLHADIMQGATGENPQWICLDRGQQTQIKSIVARSREEVCGRDGPPPDPDVPESRPTWLIRAETIHGATDDDPQLIDLDPSDELVDCGYKRTEYPPNSQEPSRLDDTATSQDSSTVVGKCSELANPACPVGRSSSMITPDHDASKKGRGFADRLENPPDSSSADQSRDRDLDRGQSSECTASDQNQGTEQNVIAGRTDSWIESPGSVELEVEKIRMCDLENEQDRVGSIETSLFTGEDMKIEAG